MNENTELLNGIQKKQDSFQREIDSLSDNVKKILSYLENDERTNTKGLVQKCRDTELRVDGLERYREELSTKMGVAGTLILLVSGLIGWITNLILKHK